ncbi:tripeptidyl-peptidase 2 isoform X1 [Rhododendron vialii]|uniref:tripeptidyl-peptidase 2 isoform X1 n=1 Tax=Rhododendron vialii TaxID=182163 RepID=UPI00265F3B37|nr:tripeptidyl-peptidase 2 isoform X1 [Rhododendron vialii]XP_058205933.1 tripeptidyl-peptidase 2 isoform X1 [Rhododendron vialii]
MAIQSLVPPFLSPPLLIIPKRLLLRISRNRGHRKFRESWMRAMPSSSSVVEDNGALRNCRLNQSTFLASLMPKKEIGADRFLEAHPEFDGRGVVIAIFDSGVDPAATGLRETSDGKPKILDVLDCTGSGDIDTSNVVMADADGSIRGASGASLIVNSSWKNPSGKWHVGCKLVYELFTDTLTSRLKKERKKKWDEKHQAAIAEAVKLLDEFDKKHVRVEDANLKRVREDLQNRVDFLRKQADSYDDKGPIVDAVVWHDGELWRVALDTQSLEDDQDKGKLANFVPLTNYRIERKFGVFSSLDACSFVANVYDEGSILSIVTDSSPHGTHVAGIASAFHPKEPLLNGVAPGAQLISCKIGDSRLGSMETGTGLTRALIAAVEHKCDLINMSYGEPTLLPDYGRFVDLVDEVVNKHRVIFVSSAGNSGPALSTVGAPGGTTSSIIGVGAYVSPAMAAGAHCVVEPPEEGLEYTWSSRGPTVDGDLGVCISAPGGAVAPVPTWTLQRRMLMNGTSMASPSACGGIALLVSAMKAEGIPVSPYMVREALENSSIPVGSLLEDKLSTGQGLMQVDKAHEYVQKLHNVPCVRYQIKINQAGKSAPTSRGIYLREASGCQQSTEWTVQVEPKFHEDACNLEQLVPFEECIELHSCGKAFVRAPEYLLLTHNGRSFNIVVDPTNLSDGLHYCELYGIDCKAPWRGPLFRIPVTITKAMAVKNRPALVSLAGMSFLPGHIERKFIEVPMGASWVEASMRTSGFDTARRFYIDTVQISPLQRPMKWEGAIIFSSPSAKTFSFQVEGGRTMELAIAQFWSSGIGSQETTVVDFEIAFHGIDINKDDVLLDGSEAPVRIDAKALLCSEKLAPAAILNKIRAPYRPIDSKLSTLSKDRDKLPSGKQTLALTLTYKFKLDDGAEVKPQIPLLNNRIYDNKFESQFYMIYDSNKRVYAMGDVYPKSAKLPKGEYSLQLYLRHDNVQYLEKMKQLLLFIERKLEDKEVIRLSFYSQPDGPVMGNGSFKSSVLVPGVKEAFYVGPPTKDKLPKNCPEGSVLLGAISYGKVSSIGQEEKNNPEKNPVSYRISYLVPPNKLDEDKRNGSSTACTKSVSERIEEKVRGAKIKVLGSLKQGTDEERSEWEKLSTSLKSEYPKYTPLLAKILEGLLSQNKVEDKIRHYEEIIDAADEVVDSVDKDELAKYFSVKSDPEDEGGEQLKKKMETTRDQFAEALYQKGLAIAEIELLKGDKASSALAPTEGENIVDRTDDQSVPDAKTQPDLFEENFKELKKWVDIKSKYGTLLVIREQRCGRLGTALKVLNDMIQEDGEPPKKKLHELKLSLLDQIGWDHLVSYERRWMHVRFPPSLPLF